MLVRSLIRFQSARNSSLWVMTAPSQMYPPSFQYKWMSSRLPSPEMVNSILNQSAQSLDCSSAQDLVTGIYSNYTAANFPSEDRLCLTKLTDPRDHSLHYLVSVLDGHGGGQCANAVANRLHACLAAVVNPANQPPDYDYSTKTQEPPQSRQAHDSRVCLQEWIEILRENQITELDAKTIKLAYLHIDDCLIREAKRAAQSLGKCPLLLDKRKSGDYEQPPADLMDYFQKSISGSCAVTAHITSNRLTIASAGDCAAILGSVEEGKSVKISGNLLVEAHTAMNLDERNRVLDEHGELERYNVIYEHRLLGSLMPFRAFGDLRLKVSLEDMDRWCVPTFGRDFKLETYETPPYLSCVPETRTIELTPGDWYLILTSDGMTGEMQADDLANLVHGYLVGEKLRRPPYLTDLDGYIHDASGQRFEVGIPEMAKKMTQRMTGIQQVSRHRGIGLDPNPATHLIRYALARNPHNVDQLQLTEELSHLSPRNIRDDMTVAVVVFKHNENDRD